ncbi:hypothetical protein C5L30_000345 [Companilactobacillus farciminis]|uniref:DUF4355 domain-containing protein n=1 Tax=Companilactobacillus farciminis TaxID=1612 RepID=A0A4R5NJ37_9LACO|nr:DUF4355 domain-containing protein [Companilactobacillus farciminis]ATO46014.1 hypothetical protein LF20184_04255 [Companilactobacillus farciminis KCTC 3681 = DSM 20184]KRK61351.1 hypothetical protein FC68_GL001112 [Companilactobacillus farciminis KCTC 3681 = DSM 20184]TDG74629.1 hypothetical protein C5L30_000345 [Companilactobacillus farciminis]
MKSLLQEPIKLNLQFFSEEGGNGSDNEGSKGPENENSDNSSDESGKENDKDSSDGEDDGKMFTRSELRKLIGSAVNEYKTSKLPNLLSEAEQKGADRANMTKDERIEADTKEREDKLNKREAALNMRDALSDTSTKLSENGLPTSFASMLSDLDEDKRTKNVKEFKKAFSEAVHKGVLEATKGGKTPQTGGSEHTEDIGSKFAEMANKQGQGLNNNPWSKLRK